MASVFSVKYLGAERKLTRDQLEKAPESLLSIILLGKDTGLVDHNALEIPSRDNAPQLAAWQAGNADLFQVWFDSDSAHCEGSLELNLLPVWFASQNKALQRFMKGICVVARYGELL